MVLARSVKGREFFQRVWFWTGSEAGAGWQVRTLAGNSGSVNSVAISADGKRVVSASWKDISNDYCVVTRATVKIWDVATGAEVRGGMVG